MKLTSVVFLTSICAISGNIGYFTKETNYFIALILAFLLILIQYPFSLKKVNRKSIVLFTFYLLISILGFYFISTPNEIKFVLFLMISLFFVKKIIQSNRLEKLAPVFLFTCLFYLIYLLLFYYVPFFWQGLQYYANYISYIIWDVRTIYSGRNDAIGTIYGFDAHLRGSIVPDALSWISYSYMVAREDLATDQESWIPMPTDIRHTISATIQDKMKWFPGSRFHMRFLLGSGYHYTNYYFEVKEDGTKEVRAGRRNARKVPYYRRFDVGCTQEFQIFGLDITLREEVLNAFNRTNVMGYSWIDGVKIVNELSRRIFNFGMDVEF